MSISETIIAIGLLITGAGCVLVGMSKSGPQSSLFGIMVMTGFVVLVIGASAWAVGQ